MSSFYVSFESVRVSLHESFLARRIGNVDAWVEQTAAWVTTAVRRSDWNDAARANDLAHWETALAMVMALQAWLRDADGRLGDGSLRATGLEPVVKNSCELCGADVPLGRKWNQRRFCSPRCAEVWTEGLLGAPLSLLGPVEPAPVAEVRVKPLELPSERDHGSDREHRGYCLGNLVDQADELSWYWGESALETGMSSNFDALANRCASGGVITTRSEPMGPNDRAMFAAGRQAEVMQAMRRVPARLQAILEIAYEDRRCRQQDVTTYGAGVAAIVQRAIADAGSSGLAVRALEAWAFPGAEPLDEARGRDLTMRLKRAATSLLADAQAAYRWARWPVGADQAPKARKRKARHQLVIVERSGRAA